ncbi:MAG: D-alanyl-D-alanine carboxypeptidase [Bacteroidaceae bacterium]|nr:D-alanyl-D-alanine carboxypeptidase [Bacteroidaceae bacterium]
MSFCRKLHITSAWRRGFRLCAVCLGLMLLLGACYREKPRPVAEKNPPPTVDPTLSHRLDSLLRRVPAKWKTAVSVYDLSAGENVYQFHADELMHTASCMKLLTGIAGLHLLGPQYTFDTELWARGKLRGDTLRGDIVMRMSFDPQFSERDLMLFLSRLKQSRIGHIEGRFFIDRRVQGHPGPEAHWYRWDYDTKELGVLYEDSLQLLRHLREALAQCEVEINDTTLRYGGYPMDDGIRIYRLRRPLSRILRTMWKWSSNMHSTALLYAIGHTSEPQKEPVQAGVRYLERFIREELGRQDSCSVIHDGCGLCIENRCSPSLFVDLLRYGQRETHTFRCLQQLLPRSGKSGTLYDRMTDSLTIGKVFAKTGTLSHPYGISTLSGYAQGGNGNLICFSIMNSEMSVLDARPLQDRICREIVRLQNY